eukprot:TRINITY_DN93375_c0_g1_i1.p1 TRINITY_DN93375_c0_g1~~TRINITY_DN93375_c0_g1_i1.p1  ORF type:complete len:382 (+),score=107.28 TRINITY_DN93375_c0_g1_i1:101-1246(+)
MVSGDGGEHKAKKPKTHHEDSAPAGGKGGKDGSKGGRGKGGGRGGGGKAQGRSGAFQGPSARPSNIWMLKPKAGRKHTVSVALPASIVENAQSFELKTMLVGQIARTLTIYAVDEVVLYEDKSDAHKAEEDEGVSRALAFFARNLQYLETPQYLRRQLIPVHRDLKWVGLLAPLDAPHHLRKSERLAYREGAVLKASDAPAAPNGEQLSGCWVNCGLDRPVWASGEEIPEDTRVTIRMQDEEQAAADGTLRGVPVDPREPTTKSGLYWGFQTRIASNVRAIFDECPYAAGYDMTIGTSERGEALGLNKIPKFQHLLLVFGGLGGLEEALADPACGYDKGTQPSTLFSRWVNICPRQHSRTIRTEEAVLITLSALSPHLPER